MACSCRCPGRRCGRSNRSASAPTSTVRAPRPCPACPPYQSAGRQCRASGGGGYPTPVGVPVIVRPIAGATCVSDDVEWFPNGFLSTGYGAWSRDGIGGASRSLSLSFPPLNALRIEANDGFFAKPVCGVAIDACAEWGERRPGLAGEPRRHRASRVRRRRRVPPRVREKAPLAGLEGAYWRHRPARRVQRPPKRPPGPERTKCRAAKRRRR